MKIAKQIEIDYGHTLPQHLGFCNQIHGHRAKIICTFGGEINRVGSKNGMVEDFGVLKDVMMSTIHQVLDHGFAVWKNDTQHIEGLNISTLDFIKARNKKYLITNEPPTAEYLAKYFMHQIFLELQRRDLTSVSIISLDWYETPNSYATAEI